MLSFPSNLTPTEEVFRQKLQAQGDQMSMPATMLAKENSVMIPPQIRSVRNSFQLQQTMATPKVADRLTSAPMPIKQLEFDPEAAERKHSFKLEMMDTMRTRALEQETRAVQKQVPVNPDLVEHMSKLSLSRNDSLQQESPNPRDSPETPSSVLKFRQASWKPIDPTAANPLQFSPTNAALPIDPAQSSIRMYQMAAAGLIAPIKGHTAKQSRPVMEKSKTIPSTSPGHIQTNTNTRPLMIQFGKDVPPHTGFRTSSRCTWNEEVKYLSTSPYGDDVEDDDEDEEDQI